MKNILLIILCCFIAFPFQAQTPSTDTFQDRVDLSNGNVLYGKVTYYAPNDTLELRFEDGRTTRLAPQMYKKVVMYRPTQQTSMKVEKPYNFREHGFYASAVYSLNFGRSDAGAHIGTGVQATAGKLFSRRFGLGGGVSYDMFYLGTANANVVSAFAEVRGYLSKRNRAEFFTCAIGYGQPLKEKNDAFAFTHISGGFMLQPTFGIRLGASKHYNFFIDAGARFQRVHYDSVSDFWENHYTVTYKRWILRGGIVF